MKRIYASHCLLLLLLCITVLTSKAQTDVLTQHNDLSRTGWYAHETALNTKNVKAGSFGKLFSRTVDDQIYAQPLVMRGVPVPNVGKRNIVFVATVNNTIYAFDADSAKVSTPYWQISLTPAGTRPPKNTDMTGACGGGYRDFSGNMGIVGTPVIDSATQTLYVVARSVTATGSKTFKQYLHALDITTGAERANSPMLIAAQIAGTGDGSVNGVVSFNPQHENQRCGLLLVNDNVYITFSSHCDWGPYHGWVLGYNKTTLQQTRVYNSTPNGYNGGIWMSGSAPSADENGNLYLAVGNGSIGANGNPADPIARSESALQLTPSGTGFTLNTFFTPSNISELEAGDLDFGVTQMMLMPGTNRVVTSCKDGHIYVMNRNNMGGYSATKNNVVQSIDLGVSAHLRSALTYYKGANTEWMYSWSENALLKAFPYNRTTGKFDLTNVISSGAQGPSGNNGALLSVSSNGSADSTAVLWASYASNGDANQSVRPGILRAFDANDVTKELWNSSQSATDNPGNYAKFNCPTIINGKVYLATFSSKLMVYGLLDTTNAGDTCGTTNIALNKTAVASSLEGDEFPASAAVDGDAVNTRWSSQYTDPQWIYVDLGKRYDLCRVTLRWEAALGEDFKIQVSDDTNSWTTIDSVAGNTDFVNEIPLKGSGRYVRMYGTRRGTGFGYSLYEFEVYGKESASNCPPPSAVTATNIYTDNAKLTWDGNGAASFTVQYKTVSAGSWTTVTTDSSFITLTGLSCGTDYLFQVQATCSNNSTSEYSSPSAFSTLSCDADCSPLPTRWTTQDIGDVAAAGSACYDNGTFNLHGSGADIWDTQDAFRFAYTTNVGDFEIKARVATQDFTSEWNKVGLMIRESLTPGSRHAFMALTSGNGAAFQSRTTTDDISNNTNTGFGTASAPYWLRIVKKGSVYTGFMSPDGNSWTQLGAATDAGFGANAVPVYAGLAITSHNDGVISTATVDNYLLSGQALPVRLMNFSASLSLNQTVNVQWVVASDEGIKQYVLQRSSDNRTYSDIATIATETKGGSAEDYSYEDKSPLHGLAYYRLRVVNLDGSATYSAVATVTFTGNKAPVLTPNPASGSVGIIPGSDLIKFITIYDISGRAIYRATNTISSKITIPVSGMSNGTYVVEMRTATTVYKEKLVVHN